MLRLKQIILTATIFILQATGAPVDQEEQEAAKYLLEIEDTLNTACYKEVESEFNYSVDMKEETVKLKNEAAKEAAKMRKKIQLEIRERFKNWQDYKNDFTRLQVKFLLSYGPANLSLESVQKMVNLQATITKLRANSKMCDFEDKTKCNLRLNPGIQTKLETSAVENNLEAAEYYWTKAHNVIGEAVTPEMFEEFVNLSNAFAQANDHDNTMSLWLSNFDDHSDGWTMEGFEKELRDTLDEFMPYYHKLHAYLRMKLKKSRGDNLTLHEDGFMHYHIFGSTDYIGSDWSLLAEETMPYPNQKQVKVDESLIEAGYTPRKIVETAEQFFTGLNEDWKLPEGFWDKSLIEKPDDEDRTASCHPEALDLCKNNDYRLTMCIRVSESDLKLAYHEVGHIIYFQEYKDLPIAFRNGANFGFHEAVGDTIALSVTPKHLRCVLKLNIDAYSEIDCNNGKQADTHPINHFDINRLYFSALFKLPKLPFGLAVDFWRTKVFSGEIGPAEYNKAWWKIREKFQGIVPSAERPADNMDAMVLFHTAANIPYIIYFTSIAYQFQFYEALCKAAGQYDPNDTIHKAPLHRCDFANSKEAGKLLKEMMSKGSSKSWKDTLETFTGSREMSLRPLIHYYKPLFDHIDKELKENNFAACFGSECKK